MDERHGELEALERTRTQADELSWSLRAVNRAGAELDRALARRMRMRFTDYEALDHILGHETDPIGPAELAQLLGISQGSASELVDRLEALGHVSRRRSDNDRRRVHLVPEPDAVERMISGLRPLFEELDEVAREFDEGERAVIDRYLRSVAERTVRFTGQIGREGDERITPGDAR